MQLEKVRITYHLRTLQMIERKRHERTMPLGLSSQVICSGMMESARALVRGFRQQEIEGNFQ